MITNVIYAVLVLGVIAVVFGLILSVAAKAFEVKVDERLPEDPGLPRRRKLRRLRLSRLRGLRRGNSCR